MKVRVVRRKPIIVMNMAPKMVRRRRRVRVVRRTRVVRGRGRVTDWFKKAGSYLYGKAMSANDYLKEHKPISTYGKIAADYLGKESPYYHGVNDIATYAGHLGYGLVPRRIVPVGARMGPSRQLYM